MFLRIALPVPANSKFDYLPCERLAPSQFRPGIRFVVPFGSRVIIGILIEVISVTECPAEKLKPVIRVLDSQPVIDASLFALCNKVAAYYHRSQGEALFLALPALLRKHHSIPENKEHFWELSKTFQQASLKPNAHKQRMIAETLRQHGGKVSENTLKALGITPVMLRPLAEKKIIFCTENVISYDDFRSVEPIIKSKPLALNTEQQIAFQTIKKHLHHFCPILLYGVTGSGKTEIYLQVITQVLMQKKQVLVLVPEIGLTPQMLSRFQKRFNLPVIVLHSGMNDRERYQGWMKARKLEAGIVISTRSGIFTGLPELGLIIVDEEHDLSYKQQEGIRYSARDLALLRGQQNNIPVILGSATPSLESLQQVNCGRYLCLKLIHRAGEAKFPQFSLIDIRKEKIYAGLSQQVITAIQKTIHQQQQVLVFINRRGFAPSLICTHCGYVINCRDCDAHLTLHRIPAHLHCHHCDYQQSIPTHCPDCHVDELVATGTGTERTEMVLQELFPETTILRIDRDSTRPKDSFNKILGVINNGKPAILVGTQMLAKGHHFPAVTLVIIINIDAGFFNADFRGEERTAQLLMQVAGRAGRESLPGHVLLQTYNPDHPDLITLIEDGYITFAENQLNYRRHHLLPPYSHLALFTVESLNRQTTQEQLGKIVSLVREYSGYTESSLKVIGPMPAPMEKRLGRFRQQLLFFATKRSTLHRFLDWFLQQLNNFSHKKQSRWVLDIDPQDMI